MGRASGGAPAKCGWAMTTRPASISVSKCSSVAPPSVVSAMTAARALSRNRDVHVVINRDGTVTVANGGK